MECGPSSRYLCYIQVGYTEVGLERELRRRLGGPSVSSKSSRPTWPPIWEGTAAWTMSTSPPGTPWERAMGGKGDARNSLPDPLSTHLEHLPLPQGNDARPLDEILASQALSSPIREGSVPRQHQSGRRRGDMPSGSNISPSGSDDTVHVIRAFLKVVLVASELCIKRLGYHPKACTNGPERTLSNGKIRVTIA